MIFGSKLTAEMDICTSKTFTYVGD